MIEYEFSNVVVEYIRHAGTEDQWLVLSLELNPNNEKIKLTFRDFGIDEILIQFEFYIEDWRDVFPRIIQERVHINRDKSAYETIFPGKLNIKGNSNPLFDLIIFSFCSRDSAELSLQLIDCSQEQIEKLLIYNSNFNYRSAIKYSKVISDLLAKAFLRVKYVIGESAPRLSHLIQIARSVIKQNENEAHRLQNIIDKGPNKIVYISGPFLVVEVKNYEEFDNIFESVDYAIMDISNFYGCDSEKLSAVAIGKKREDKLWFSLTFSHVEWDFWCDGLEEAPAAAFSAIESYSDMVS